MAGPLAGVRVVEMGTMIAGPLATMILADQGADVVKIETVGAGDPMRPVGVMGSGRNGMTAMFAGCNRGKRSVAIDITTPDGRALLHQLAAGADVFVQNMRPGAAERHQVGEADLRATNPDLVYVSISGFGSEGPLRGVRVYDFVIQAASGLAAAQAGGGPAQLVRTLACDKITALTAAQAITAALLARASGAGGQHVSLNMLDASVAFLWPDTMAPQSLLSDDAAILPPLADAFLVFPTADGAVACTYVTELGPILAAILGHGGVAGDDRFTDPESRARHAADLQAEVEKAFALLPTAQVLERMAAADMPCAEVVSPDELHLHPQIVANETLVETEQPHVGRLREPRPAARFSSTPAAIAGYAPALGEHTDEVLRALGLDGEQITELRRAGVVG